MVTTRDSYICSH